jgi:hypothetical protein
MNMCDVVIIVYEYIKIANTHRQVKCLICCNVDSQIILIFVSHFDSQIKMWIQSN